MKGLGTVDDPWQVVTLDDFKSAGLLGGEIVFVNSINLSGFSFIDIIKNDVVINLNSHKLILSKYSLKKDRFSIFIHSQKKVEIHKGIVEILGADDHWGVTVFKSPSSDSISYHDLIIKMKGADDTTVLSYEEYSKYVNKTCLLWFEYSGTQNRWAGAGFYYLLKNDPVFRNAEYYISPEKESDWKYFPTLDKSIWEMTPEGPKPKSTDITYVEGKALVNGIPAAGRMLEVQTLHSAHPKVLRMARSEEGGKFKIGLSGYSYPVMVFAYDDVQDVIEPGTDYPVDYRLLPPVSNGTWLRCITAGKTPAVLPGVPVKGEVTIGTATFEIKPLAPPSVHGPLTPAVQTL